MPEVFLHRRNSSVELRHHPQGPEKRLPAGGAQHPEEKEGMTGQRVPAPQQGIHVDESQFLLLKAIIPDESGPLPHYAHWRDSIDFDNLDGGSFRLLPMLYKRLEGLCRARRTVRENQGRLPLHPVQKQPRHVQVRRHLQGHERRGFAGNAPQGWGAFAQVLRRYWPARHERYRHHAGGRKHRANVSISCTPRAGRVRFPSGWTEP